MKTVLKITTLQLASLLMVATPSWGALRTWNNSDPVNGGLWNVDANWLDPIAPTGSDTVLINNGGRVNITTADAAVSATSMVVGSTTVNNRLIIAGHTLKGGNIDIGEFAGSEGSITIQNGGTLRTDGAGSFRRMLIGYRGKGTVTVEAGGTFLTGADAFRLGSSAGGEGVISVHGHWNHGGALALGYNGSGELTIGAGGTVQVSGLLTMGEGSVASGVINIGGHVGAGSVAATPEAAGRLEVTTIRGGSASGSGGTATLNFNHTDARYEFTGAAQAPITITGNTLTRVNLFAGTTVLNGANTYKGATRVTGGTLLANYTGAETGASSTGTGLVTVEAGGTLGGIGRITGATEVLGTLTPGDGTNGTGVLSFDGDLTLGADSLTLLRLGGEARGTEHDGINVGGSFTLDGTLRLVLEEELLLQPDDELTFQLFQSDGFNGTFTLLDLPEISGGLALNWDTSLLYNDGSVSLSVTAIPEPGVAWLLLGVGAAAGVRFALKRRSLDAGTSV